MLYRDFGVQGVFYVLGKYPQTKKDRGLGGQIGVAL